MHPTPPHSPDLRDSVLAEIDTARAALQRADESLRTLRAEQTQPVAPPAPVPPHPGHVPTPPQPVAKPNQHAPAPAFLYPDPPARHPGHRPEPTRAPKADRPERSRALTIEQAVLRVFAIAGIAITVLGVGFAVAIQTGLLGPSAGSCWRARWRSPC